MSKSRRSQRSAGRNTNNYEYKKEVSCKDNYLSDKHKEAREDFIKNNPIVPMNPKQRKYIELLEDKKCIIACGLAGTSKTYIPTATFADWYRTGKIDKIVLVRPAVSNSKSLGFFAGSLETKASIWLAPILDVLHRRLGKAVTMLAIEKGDIEFVPLETVKGRSFGENTAVIITEAEDCTKDEIMSLLTRQNGCHMVIEGDILQSALKHTSGLKTAIDLLHKHPILQETMGYIEFNDFGDIVRSKECREWIKVFVKEGLM